MSCKFYFLNVGYGCCTVIKWNEKAIVVDCKKGDKNSGEDNVIDYLPSSEIEILVITHPHKDHFDGVSEIFEKNINIKEVWLSPYEMMKEDKETDSKSYYGYFNLIDTINNYGIPIKKVSRSKKHLYGSSDASEMKIFVLNPPVTINQKEGRTIHDGCIILKIVTHDKTAILGADARNETWKVIGEYAPQLLQSDIFYVSHHGASDGLEKNVFEKINPNIIVLSTKIGIYEGIPDSETINYYKSFKNKKLLRTDECGTIVI